MEFDINTLRGLATVFCMIAFFAVVMWAYSDRKRADFDEAANLPFADDQISGTATARPSGPERGLSSPELGTNNKKESPHV
ncbi:cbb3-type cytochrome c oxidase subunit 3 [Sansalvadorimonas sp. 2012CJ34-2]|uniref:Cbb3-type cytochrome c oxidase subunit 3 n=1 Tax=Parendozoicomonas callyspongiae TaxID=2942213 RepID=A0ABT0PI13_9GAMM|nr:cbb3-type cytochrome c oxidase subunit 3 [Sansalvadorimonas sp. 2012CJ34-2]MCL6271014.1 cbb3-type cytochrome c oxidase subunit 3 [Sansalvadorimonas sp. 2012CJ34-2]